MYMGVYLQVFLCDTLTSGGQKKTLHPLVVCKEADGYWELNLGPTRRGFNH